MEQLAGEIQSTMGALSTRYEVLFVDDGSTDGSFETLQRIAATDSRVRLLRFRFNCGQSAALAAGFLAARANAIVTLDADLQNDPADIPRLLEALEYCDVVSGVRQRRQDGWLRRLSSRVANRARGWLLADGISDVGCALKAYRRCRVLEAPVFNGMHRFLPALIQMAGGRAQEVAVGHRPRRFGASKYGLNDRLWRGLADLAAVYWLKRRWIDVESVREIDPRDPAAPASSARTRTEQPHVELPSWGRKPASPSLDSVSSSSRSAGSL